MIACMHKNIYLYVYILKLYPGVFIRMADSDIRDNNLIDSDTDSDT